MTNSFDQAVIDTRGGPLQADRVRIIQANLGLLCNLNCRHCHVDASPKREEIMAWPTMAAILRLADAMGSVQLDLTGGAPELNPHFRALVRAARDRGHAVQVRTNLTVFFEAGLSDTPEFLADHQVQLVASLPCYLDENVDHQRGRGTYRQSVAALRRLNALGYGIEEDLPLNLVYNPGGAFLPPGQEDLEEAYRRELSKRFGISFSKLLTITNMPLGRFLRDLKTQGEAAHYESLLRDNFNPSTLENLMCRHQVCVSWDGTLADCDFNIALGLGLDRELPTHIDQVTPAMLKGRGIVTGPHCFGCTAGCGSSCGGALVA